MDSYVKGEMQAKDIGKRNLRRIFGPKSNENGEWRRLHNEELHSLYRSPNIARMIKSRRLRWAGHVARMEQGRSAFKILTEVYNKSLYELCDQIRCNGSLRCCLWRRPLHSSN